MISSVMAYLGWLVCVAGFEPATPAVQVRYSDQAELHTDENKSAGLNRDGEPGA